MPLLDHFHPPWLKQRPWDSFHAAWANALAEQLNDGVLPPSFVALPLTQLGGRIEVDVAAVNGAAGTPEGGAATAVWAPPQPTLDAPIDFTHLDVFEVRVQRDDDSPQLVAAIELVSPANKVRVAHRRAFAVKCASYLQQGVGLVVVDVVTHRSGDLHGDLFALLGLPPHPRPRPAPGPLRRGLPDHRTRRGVPAAIVAGGFDPGCPAAEDAPVDHGGTVRPGRSGSGVFRRPKAAAHALMHRTTTRTRDGPALRRSARKNGLRKCEAIPLHLMESKRSGEWIRVHEFCLHVGVSVGELKPELFATWLPDPMAHEAECRDPVLRRRIEVEHGRALQSKAPARGCVARPIAAADPGRPSGFVRFNVSAGGPDG